MFYSYSIYLILFIIQLFTNLTLAAEPVQAPPFKFSMNMPAALQNQIISDFLDMTSIRGTHQSPLHKKIFGGHGLDGRVYQKFILSRVQEFEYWSSPNSGVYLMSAGAVEGEQKIIISARYYSLSTSLEQIIRQALYIHEARHNEEDNEWAHSPCPSPFLDKSGNAVISILDGQNIVEKDGSASCDIVAFGSYGVSLIMARNIQKYCTSCSNESRVAAGKFADNMLLRIIDPKAKAALIMDAAFRVNP